MQYRTNIAAAVFLAVGSLAHAQAPASKQPPSSTPPKQELPEIYFATVDKNGDRSVSRAEALQVPELASAFEMLDADRNESISPTEFSRWSRAGKVASAHPADPATVPGGSAGAQHMPDVN